MAERSNAPRCKAGRSPTLCIIMIWHTYILQSIKNRHFYIGHTSNIQKRLLRHNRGGNVSTKNGRPWFLAHQEEYLNKSDAIKREIQIKKYKGGQAFKNLMKHAWVAERSNALDCKSSGLRPSGVQIPPHA